jgi:putative membrane protein
VSQTPTPVPSDSGEKLTERPHPLTPLIRGWVVLLAIVIGFGKEMLPNFESGEARPLPPVELLFSGGGLVVLGAAAIGFFSWYFTRFVIDADELRIDTGMLLRRSQRIAFDKVASIDVVQPLAARMFGLAELEIDIGSSERAKLRYLGRARAYTLRDYLLNRAHGHHEAPIVAGSDPGLQLTDLQSEDRLVTTVTSRALVLGAITSNEFIQLVIAMAATLALAAFWGFGVVLLGLAISAASGVVGFITRRVTGQFNYTLSVRPAGLRISRGLTSLTSQSLPPRRIQLVRLSQSLLWRRFGWYRVEVDVLGVGMHNEEGTRAAVSSVLLPVGTMEQVRLALAEIWPDTDYEAVELHRAPFRARWLHPFSGPFLAMGHDASLVVSRHGWLERHWDLVPHSRIQSLRIAQGPLSARLGLADLGFHTAGSHLNARANGLDAGHVLQRQAELIELAQARSRDITVKAQAAGPDVFRADHAVETISSTE